MGMAEGPQEGRWWPMDRTMEEGMEWKWRELERISYGNIEKMADAGSKARGFSGRHTWILKSGLAADAAAAGFCRAKRYPVCAG